MTNNGSKFPKPTVREVKTRQVDSLRLSASFDFLFISLFIHLFCPRFAVFLVDMLKHQSYVSCRLSGFC